MTLPAHRLIIAWTVEGLASFLSHPSFEHVVRQSAKQKAHQFAVEPSLHRFAMDRGFSLLGIFAVYLHFSDDGLTVSALKRVAAASGAASAGRVSSFVAMMRKIGAIKAAAIGQDRRVRRLALSEPFLAFMRARLRIEIAALGLLSPLGEQSLEDFERPDFFGNYMRLAARWMAGYRPTRDGVIEFFADRHMGLQILYDIVGNNEQALRSLPVSISVADLSKRFGVARSHVLKLLRDADAKGFVNWSAKTRSITLSSGLVHTLKQYVAILLIGAAHLLTSLQAERRKESLSADEPAAHAGA